MFKYGVSVASAGPVVFGRSSGCNAAGKAYFLLLILYCICFGPFFLSAHRPSRLLLSVCTESLPYLILPFASCCFHLASLNSHWEHLQFSNEGSAARGIGRSANFPLTTGLPGYRLFMKLAPLLDGTSWQGMSNNYINIDLFRMREQITRQLQTRSRVNTI